METDNRHDPFGEDDFLGEVAEFETKKLGEKKHRPREEDVEKMAQARGFDNRAPVSKPVKEPLKPLQFRLPASEVNAFRETAYQEFGPGQGALVALFRKLWNDYRDSRHGSMDT